MAKRSKGKRSRTRKKLSKNPRHRGLSPVTRSLQTFEVGDRVAIDIDASVHDGQPHPRFQGLTGTVVDTQGRAYVVEVRTGDKMKQVIAIADHLKPQES